MSWDLLSEMAEGRFRTHCVHTRDDPNLVLSKHILLGSRGAMSLVVAVCLTTLATCFVVARVYTRKYIIRHFEPNDWTVIISLVGVKAARQIDQSYQGPGLFICLFGIICLGSHSWNGNA